MKKITNKDWETIINNPLNNTEQELARQAQQETSKAYEWSKYIKKFYGIPYPWRKQHLTRNIQDRIRIIRFMNKQK